LGANNAHRRHSVGLIDQLDVAKNVGAFFLEDAADFNGQQADFRISVNASAQLEKMPPGARVPCDKNFRFAGVGQN